ncbi:MAG: ParB/RepB/Spo0J family partition protein [Phycisphaeraceae bacterium]|nr:MAG: ParB/RepB/Spo0J family partition protein [Phycisphaeraceae bacterium]
MSESKPTSAKRRRLGKGLHAIVGAHPAAINTEQKQIIQSHHERPAGHRHVSPAEPVVEVDHGDRVVLIALDRITPGRHQPRSSFDDAALASLADSIRAVGVIQPIVVRSAGSDGFELIAGERRWRAARLAGHSEIPAIVRESDERTSAEAALIENIQREDLNPIERAEGLRGLLDRFGLTQQEIAARVGLDRSSVSNLIRLLELEPGIRSLLETGHLGLGHGKALLSVEPGGTRESLAKRAADGGWSVRRLEAESKKAALVVRRGAKEPDDEIEMRDLEKRLGEHLGTKVRIRAGRGGRGTLVIGFFGLDHFDDLMSRIGYTESNGI